MINLNTFIKSNRIMKFIYCIYFLLFLFNIQEITAQPHPTEYLTLHFRKNKTVDFAFQKATKIEWEKYEMNLSIIEKDTLLKTITRNNLFSLENFIEAIKQSEDSTTPSEAAGYLPLHWLDINADGKADLVYEGNSLTGSEGSHFILWLNKNDKLTLVFALNARIYQIEKNINTHFIDFQLIKTPCCAEYAFTYYQLCFACNNNCLDVKTGSSFVYNSYNISDKSGCMNLKIAYSFPGGILLPDIFTKSEKIILSKNTLLTIIPRKLSKKYKPFPKMNKQHSHIDASDFGLQTQLVISEFPRNSQAIILFTQVDNLGNTFHFIAIENRQAKQSLFPKQSNFWVYGWINIEKIRN